MHKITVASFCWSYWECELTQSRSPLPQMMQVASVPLGLLWRQESRWFPVVHIQRSCRFLRNPRQSSWLSNLCIFKTTRNGGRGAYARDELNTWANTPSPLLSKSSVQKGGGGSVFWGAYGTLLFRPYTNHFHLSMKHIHISYYTMLTSKRYTELHFTLLKSAIMHLEWDIPVVGTPQ